MRVRTVRGLLWATLVAAVGGTLWNVSGWIRPTVPEIRSGQAIRLPEGAAALQAGGVLVVLGEDCPACIEFAGVLEEILGANGLGEVLAHAVIVGGEPGQSSIEQLLVGKIGITLDPSAAWAERNGFHFGPIVALLEAGGRVDRLLAWNTSRNLVPYPPQATLQPNSTTSPIFHEEVSR